jgi:hypothetical protein
MFRTSKAILATVGAAAIAGGAAEAHHSTAMFAWGKEVTIPVATVEKWEWTNPHTFLYVTTPDGQHWAFEGMSPSHLARSGWSKRTVNAGDKIGLVYYPLKDGRKGGFDIVVMLPNGQKMFQLHGPQDDPSKDTGG